MKKLIGYALFIIAALYMLLIVIFIFPFAISYGFKTVFGNEIHLFGYELHCYTGHEGPNCIIRPTSEAQAEQEEKEKAEADARQKEFERNYQCKTDDDCTVTNGGACVIKASNLAKDLGASPAKDETQNNCRCLSGPVMFGCVPSKDYESFHQ